METISWLNKSVSYISDHRLEAYILSLPIILHSSDFHVHETYQHYYEIFEELCSCCYGNLDEKYEEFGHLNRQVQCAYEDIENSPLHDKYLSLRLEIEARMAEILIAYDEPLYDEYD